MNKPIPLIHDGDHGSDDVIASLIALAHPETFNLLGITTQFGNVPVEITTRNALRCLDIANRADVGVYEGTRKPFRQDISPLGDNAFGKDGIGGVTLPSPKGVEQQASALDFMIRALETAEDKVNFALTGPCSNFALLLEKRPDLKPKIGTVAIMGGCLEPQGSQARRGNIKPYAEFNFFMDPEAADYVLASGLDIVLFPLDVTHQLLFSDAQQKDLIALCGEKTGGIFSKIMLAASHLDEKNFNVQGAYQHDQQTILYFMDEGLFETKTAALEVHINEGERGDLRYSEKPDRAPVKIALTLKNKDLAFDYVARSLKLISGDYFI